MNAFASGPDLSGSKQRLLLEAERAFGLHGIAGASLREIAERAGHRNRTNAVQYHFGDRDGLVAISGRHHQESLMRSLASHRGDKQAGEKEKL